MPRRDDALAPLGKVTAHERRRPFAIAGIDRVEDREVLLARLHQRLRVGGERRELLELAQAVDLLDRLQHEAVSRELGQHLVETRIHVEEFAGGARGAPLPAEAPIALARAPSLPPRRL